MGFTLTCTVAKGNHSGDSNSIKKPCTVRTCTSTNSLSTSTTVGISSRQSQSVHLRQRRRSCWRWCQRTPSDRFVRSRTCRIVWSCLLNSKWKLPQSCPLFCHPPYCTHTPHIPSHYVTNPNSTRTFGCSTSANMYYHKYCYSS
jgi:hypothetical protein